MRVLRLNPHSIDLALAVLAGGGIVVHPTETCYGLACDLTNPSAVAGLFHLKQRSISQPVSALFSSITDARRYVEWPKRAQQLAENYLPGPLTLILPLRTDAPYRLYPIPTYEESLRKATIGVRISSHPLAQELVQRFGRPLSTTSANVHGQPAAYSSQEVASQFPDHLPNVLLLNGGAIPRLPPSTIIDLTGLSPSAVRRGYPITEMGGV